MIQGDFDVVVVDLLLKVQSFKISETSNKIIS